MLSLFHKNPPLAVEAGKCVADQLRPLVCSNRGDELMLLMYSDPYAALGGLPATIWFPTDGLPQHCADLVDSVKGIVQIIGKVVEYEINGEEQSKEQ